ncbi:MAG: hypothetical protein AB9856_01640 [Cellulosilyticaceae bacterium]
MKKTGFIIGSIEIILGLMSLIVIALIQQVIPKIARMCYMFNIGSFGEFDYIINTNFCNIIAICLCLIGGITVIYFGFWKKDEN